jgi:hypothetical protein
MRATSFLLVIAACERPASLVICHNGNCAEPADPARDVTIEALRESLALESEPGIPVFDGIELDTYWRGADDLCLYAHDLDGTPVPALEPVAELDAFLARSPGRSSPFYVAVELKSTVDEARTISHSDAQLALHAGCAWQLHAAIAEAALRHDRDVVVIFQAFRPALLETVLAQTPVPLAMPVEYSAVQGAPGPLSKTRPLREYARIPLSYVEFNAPWITEAQYEAVRSLGAAITFYMFSATSETFGLIEQYRPALIVTSEASLMRRWLDR